MRALERLEASRVPADVRYSGPHKSRNLYIWDTDDFSIYYAGPHADLEVVSKDEVFQDPLDFYVLNLMSLASPIEYWGASDLRFEPGTDSWERD